MSQDALAPNAPAAKALAKAAELACWSGPVTPAPLSGGITNLNFVVEDGGQRFFVRIGEDIPIHGVLRFNELAAARAAELAGVSPALIYSEPGVMVTRFIDGRTYEAADLRVAERLGEVVALIKRVHHDMPKHLRGPVLMFWVFHVIRDYAATLREDQSPRVPQLTDLLARAEALEQAVGAIDLVFGHNDLLPGNFIDDGERIWLVDWDAGPLLRRGAGQRPIAPLRRHQVRLGAQRNHVVHGPGGPLDPGLRLRPIHRGQPRPLRARLRRLRGSRLMSSGLVFGVCPALALRAHYPTRCGAPMLRGGGIVSQGVTR
jgi:thiamine kinase-like enzyme